MSANPVPDRCRVVLIIPQDASIEQVSSALDGGDIASVILPQYALDDAAFQKRAEAIAKPSQQAGAALIIAGDSRTAGRIGADGIHLDANLPALAEALDKSNGRMIVGYGGPKTRHDSLTAGEIGPDYLFFGKFGYDNTPDAHPRNLSLGEWWAQMVEIPGIVMAGSSIDSIIPVAETGTDFVAVSRMVFEEVTDPGRQIARINALLDEHAPRLES